MNYFIILRLISISIPILRCVHTYSIFVDHCQLTQSTRSNDTFDSIEREKLNDISHLIRVTTLTWFSSNWFFFSIPTLKCIHTYSIFINHCRLTHSTRSNDTFDSIKRHIRHNGTTHSIRTNNTFDLIEQHIWFERTTHSTRSNDTFDSIEWHIRLDRTAHSTRSNDTFDSIEQHIQPNQTTHLIRTKGTFNSIEWHIRLDRTTHSTRSNNTFNSTRREKSNDISHSTCVTTLTQFSFN